MTLLVRDERDIVEDHLAFHLAAGVDLVIVTDHASSDGTEEVLARYERDGRVPVFREPEGPFRQREWVTRMARLAATEHGADWVVTSDADEFWWPRGGSLGRGARGRSRADTASSQSFVRHFVPVPDDGRPFAERMTYGSPRRRRSTTRAARGGPSARSSTERLPTPRSSRAAIRSAARGLVPMRGWYPIEVLHFPIRTAAQLERKGPRLGSRRREVLRRAGGRRAGPGAAYHALPYEDSERGRSDDGSLVDLVGRPQRARRSPTASWSRTQAPRRRPHGRQRRTRAVPLSRPSRPRRPPSPWKLPCSVRRTRPRPALARRARARGSRRSSDRPRA